MTAQMKHVRGTSEFREVAPGIGLLVQYGHAARYSERQTSIHLVNGYDIGSRPVLHETLLHAFRVTVANQGLPETAFRVQATRYADRSRSTVVERNDHDTPLLREGEQGSVEIVMPSGVYPDTTWIDGITVLATGEVHKVGSWLLEQAPDAVGQEQERRKTKRAKFLRRFVLLPLLVIGVGYAAVTQYHANQRQARFNEIYPVSAKIQKEGDDLLRAAWVSVGGRSEQWGTHLDAQKAYELGIRQGAAERYGSAVYALAARFHREASVSPSFDNRYRAALHCDKAWLWATSSNARPAWDRRGEFPSQDPQWSSEVFTKETGAESPSHRAYNRERRPSTYNALPAKDRDAVTACYQMFGNL